MINQSQFILEFIAKFGVVHERHLENLLGSVDKMVLKTLIRDEYINTHQLKITQGAYYSLGKIGAKLMDSKEIKDLNYNNLNHDMLLLDLYFDILSKNPEHEIKSEREMKVGQGLKVGDKKKFPDLLMIDQIGYATAIELEISEKSQSRLIEIINNYIQDTKLTAIHYYVKSQSLGRKLLTLSGSHPKLKVFLLSNDEDILNYTEVMIDKEIPPTKSPWSFDLDHYLNNPDKYLK